MRRPLTISKISPVARVTGVVLPVVLVILTLLLRETGPKARKTREAPPIGAGLPAE